MTGWEKVLTITYLDGYAPKNSVAEGLSNLMPARLIGP